MQVWRKSIWVDGFDDFVSLLLMEGSSQGRAGLYVLFMGSSLKMALATLAFLILRNRSLFYLLHLRFRHLIYFTRADEENLSVFILQTLVICKRINLSGTALKSLRSRGVYHLTLFAFPLVYFSFLSVLKICYLDHPQNTLFDFVFAVC